MSQALKLDLDSKRLGSQMVGSAVHPIRKVRVWDFGGSTRADSYKQRHALQHSLRATVRRLRCISVHLVTSNDLSSLQRWANLAVSLRLRSEQTYQRCETPLYKGKPPNSSTRGFLLHELLRCRLVLRNRFREIEGPQRLNLRFAQRRTFGEMLLISAIL